MSTTIEDRFILILREQITARDRAVVEREDSLWERLKLRWSPPAFPGRGAWESIENRTGISSQSWRSAYSRRQKPTTGMIEAIAKLFPKYAFWLATGITDAVNGHVAPMTALAFPERLYRETFWGTSYFKQSIELAEKLYEAAEVDPADERQRMYAVERTKPLAHWVGGPLVNVAYKLTESDEYKALVELWHKREEERKQDLDRIEGRARPWETDKPEDVGRRIDRDPILGADSRTAHQDPWDLFYSLPDKTKAQASTVRTET